MKNNYNVGQRFVLKKDSAFYNEECELIDVSKGTGFYINDIIENCGEFEEFYFMVIFEGNDVEVRFSKEEIDDLV